MTPPPDMVWLELTLVSDSTFGRGDGVAGWVNAEVQHDDYGLPFLAGKTLKGLLTAECAEILHALRNAGVPIEPWYEAAQFLLGEPGSDGTTTGKMMVAAARLPDDLRLLIEEEFAQLSDQESRNRQRLANLASLTTIRHQTAMDDLTGAPKENTLRAMRVIVRQCSFVAPLEFSEPPPPIVLALLAALVSTLRRAGTGRNRGRGRVKAQLYDLPPWKSNAQDKSDPWLALFNKEVRDARANVSH